MEIGDLIFGAAPPGGTDGYCQDETHTMDCRKKRTHLHSDAAGPSSPDMKAVHPNLAFSPSSVTMFDGSNVGFSGDRQTLLAKDSNRRREVSNDKGSSNEVIHNLASLMEIANVVIPEGPMEVKRQPLYILKEKRERLLINFTTHLNTAVAKHAETEKELKELNEEVASVEMEKKFQEERGDESIAKMQMIAGELQQTKQELSRKNAAVADLKTKIEQYAEKVSQFEVAGKDKEESHYNRCKELMTSLDERDAVLEGVKRALSSEISSLNARLTETEEELFERNVEISGVQSLFDGKSFLFCDDCEKMATESKPNSVENAPVTDSVFAKTSRLVSELVLERERNGNLRKESSRMEEEIRALNARLGRMVDLEYEVEKRDLTLKFLSVQLDNSKNEACRLEEMAMEHANAKNIIRVLEQEVARSKSIATERLEHVAELDKERKALIMEVAKIRDEAERMTGSLNAAAASEKERNRASVQGLEKLLHSLRQEMDTASMEVKLRHSQAVQKMQNTITSLGMEKKTLMDDVKEAKVKGEEAADRNHSFEAAIEKIQIERQGEAEQLQMSLAVITNLEASIREMETRLAASEEEKAAAAHSMTEQQEEIQSLKASLMTQKDTYSRHISAVDERIQKADGTIDFLQHERKALLEENKKIKATRAKDTASLQTEHGKLLIEIEKVRGEVEITASAMAAAKVEKNDLLLEMEKAEAKGVDLANHLARLTEEKKHLLDELVISRETADSNAANVASLEREKKALLLLGRAPPHHASHHSGAYDYDDETSDDASLSGNVTRDNRADVTYLTAGDETHSGFGPVDLLYCVFIRLPQKLVAAGSLALLGCVILVFIRLCVDILWVSFADDNGASKIGARIDWGSLL